MKANVLYGINDLRYTDYPTPLLKKDEVLVKVMACGICGSDVGRVFKTGTYHFPTIIGHEFSGVVAAANPDDKDGTELIGKRVGVFPLKPCFECHNCKEGKYEMCVNYDYLGSRCDGGFAEFVAVPKWNLIPLPDTVSFEQAAMLEPCSVALHALRRFSSVKGKTLVLFGPGTIGNILIRIARSLKANKIIVVGRNTEKLSIAKNNGADFIIDSTSENVSEEILNLTENKGAQLIVEGTGAVSCLNDAILAAKGEGEIVLMGNPAGDYEIEKKVYWQILRKQLKLFGTWNSSFGFSEDDWHLVLDMMAKGELNPETLITHTFPLSDLKKGLEIMADKNIISNKVMVIANG